MRDRENDDIKLADTTNYSIWGRSQCLGKEMHKNSMGLPSFPPSQQPLQCLIKCTSIHTESDQIQLIIIHYKKPLFLNVLKLSFIMSNIESNRQRPKQGWGGGKTCLCCK